jgi:hypothetical protein
MQEQTTATMLWFEEMAGSFHTQTEETIAAKSNLLPAWRWSPYAIASHICDTNRSKGLLRQRSSTAPSNRSVSTGVTRIGRSDNLE